MNFEKTERFIKAFNWVSAEIKEFIEDDPSNIKDWVEALIEIEIITQRLKGFPEFRNAYKGYEKIWDSVKKEDIPSVDDIEKEILSNCDAIDKLPNYIEFYKSHKLSDSYYPTKSKDEFHTKVKTKLYEIENSNKLTKEEYTASFIALDTLEHNLINISYSLQELFNKYGQQEDNSLEKPDADDESKKYTNIFVPGGYSIFKKFMDGSVATEARGWLRECSYIYQKMHSKDQGERLIHAWITGVAFSEWLNTTEYPKETDRKIYNNSLLTFSKSITREREKRYQQAKQSKQ